MPSRKPRKEKGDGDRKSPRPYTAQAINALACGLTWRDLRHMKHTHLVQLLWEWDDMHGADVDEVVDATSEDVMALTRL